MDVDRPRERDETEAQRIDRNWIELMGQRPTRDLWSVGPKTSEKLAAHGIHTVDDLIGPSSVVRRRLRAHCTGLTD